MSVNAPTGPTQPPHIWSLFFIAISLGHELVVVRRPVAHGLARDGGRGEAGNERGREEHHDNGLQAGQGDRSGRGRGGTRIGISEWMRGESVDASECSRAVRRAVCRRAGILRGAQPPVGPVAMYHSRVQRVGGRGL